MKKAISILLVFMMMLSVSPLQSFAANNGETSTFEMLSVPDRPFILGLDGAQEEYIWKYDETLGDWVNTGIWYYRAPVYGIELKITYGDGTSAIISKEDVYRYFTCRVYEEPAGGTVKASLELSKDYDGYDSGLKIMTFQMNVVENYVDSIEVLSAPTVFSFKNCNDISLEGMRLKINYAGGTSDVYDFGEGLSDYGNLYTQLHKEWLDVYWDEEGDFSGDTIALEIHYLDCVAGYALPLVDSPYASIEIVDCDSKLIDEEYGIYEISGLTVNITKKDGIAATYNCESDNSEINYTLPGDLDYEEYCVVDGHTLKIALEFYSDSHQKLLVKYVNVADSYEIQDSRSAFEKFFDKIAMFFSDFLFQKLFYALYWLF